MIDNLDEIYAEIDRRQSLESLRHIELSIEALARAPIVFICSCSKELPIDMETCPNCGRTT